MQLEGATNWYQISLWGNNSADYGIRCNAYMRLATATVANIKLTGTVDDVILGGNALSYSDLPHKNTLPNQAAWDSGVPEAVAGTDTNDYHIILNTPP